ncbi:MAG: tRNA adenosine(34) deaminase TadA [Deltaproteobacteria bacterium]|nr:tRNA adenosine(34) deaminase TadA [Deltaproteobacteria bacterium]
MSFTNVSPSSPLTPEVSQFFMSLALQKAEEAARNGEVPAGAVIFDSAGQVLAQEANQVIGLADPTAHAEILAIRQAAKVIGNYRLTGLSLATTLEPCPMCLMAAIHARLGHIYFGADEPKWGAAGSLLDLLSLSGLNHRPTITGGILAEPCARLMRDFFKSRRPVPRWSVVRSAGSTH